MSTALAGAVLVLIVTAWLPLTLLSGRWGVLPWLVPADTRAWFRHRWKGGDRSRQRSARWPARLKRAVWAADQGRCAYCRRAKGEPHTDGRGRVQAMHIDHLKPWLYGGVTCLWNGFLLCDRHNEIKRAYFVRRDGSVYRGLSGALAPDILAAELRRRHSPLRLLRAVRALAA